MEWGTTTLAFYGLGAAAVATSLVTLRRRLELSKAKHGTLGGHANLARRLALLVPFYDFDERGFFCSLNALMIDVVALTMRTKSSSSISWPAMI